MYSYTQIMVSRGAPVAGARPVLKWAGGKRALLPTLEDLIVFDQSENFTKTFFEPFLGGGAVLFSRTDNCKLVGGDTNVELINLYEVIRDSVDDLITLLSSWPVTQEHYYFLRSLDRTSGFDELTVVDRAARMIFLNKAGYNGLYRVNRNGQFNVPYGHRSNARILDELSLRQLSRFLSIRMPNGLYRTELQTGDYQTITANAKSGDIVYFDPPYDNQVGKTSFVSYQGAGFGWQSQVALSEEFRRLANLGVQVVLSNSHTERLFDLYKDFEVEFPSVRRQIGASANSRRKVTEIIVHANVGKKNLAKAIG